MKKLRVLDLFSGIGGFSLGLERTGGFETVAFCEIEPYCRAVLRKHWPDVPCYEDVRTLTADALSRDGIAVDVICGGFPCQDVSFAGKRAGLEGARSGLWREYARLVGELRPRFVVVENVPGLLNLGMGAVLGDLSALGYDAVWDCIPAAAVGAPHRRDRVWLVAHCPRLQPGRAEPRAERERARACSQPQPAPDPLGHELRQQSGRSRRTCRASETQPREHGASCLVAYSPIDGRGSRRQSDAEEEPRGRQSDRSGIRFDVRDPNVSGLALRQGQSRDVGEEFPTALGADWWLVEPDVGRVAHGVPARVDRLKCLGNAVVPQITELIGRAILKAEGLAA